uniref:THAP-type domain-containing protein n=1 Tax=Sphaeramia orbicularis TaxID=375764 RepID=A0A672ZTC8_9TELE
MPSSCCAVCCQNRKNTQKDLNFYRIPAGKHPFQKNRRKLCKLYCSSDGIWCVLCTHVLPFMCYLMACQFVFRCVLHRT